MRKLFSLVPVLALAACAANEPVTPQAPVVTSSGAPAVSGSGGLVTSSANPSVRPGYGIVEAVSLVHHAPAPSAAAGGTAPAVPGPFRLMLRMDDGTSQEIVQDYRGFLVGDRVQVTADGRILRN
jgi:hypothetical protein